MTETESKAEQKTPRVPLGASYWKLWSASVVSNLGDGVAFIAYPWLASAVTRNAVLIALIAVAQPTNRYAKAMSCRLMNNPMAR